MKSFNNLYGEIYSIENLYAAARKARKRKSRKEDVEHFELHRERFIAQLHDELRTHSWQPSPYKTFQIHDPKTRTIRAAPFRDRVVHHALVNIIGPLIERRFIYDSYSCRKGKGTLAGRERCRVYTNRYKYALKCDVQKYFDSIDHELLLSKIGHVIRCRPTLELCERIIESLDSKDGVSAYCEGDDLFAVFRPCGLPIGNLTSQLWANLYLDRIDHLVKEAWRVPAYVRYTDDFILWSNDKAELKEYRKLLRTELAMDRLRLHEKKSKVIAVRDGVPFLGFRFFPDRRPRLLGKCKRRFERRMRGKHKRKRSDKESSASIRESAAGWKAFADYGNVKGLYRKYAAVKFG